MIGATQLNSSLLTISVIAVLLPAAFQFATTTLSVAQENRDILSVSHGVCVVIMNNPPSF
jgi:Ca2+:H+ antiporter